jgi:hypothetical protein
VQPDRLGVTRVGVRQASAPLAPSRKQPVIMNNKFFDMVFNLKFQAKQLNRQAAKCEKDEKVEKDKAFKAMRKNNMDGAQIHASNAIRLHNENLQFLRIASQYVSPGLSRSRVAYDAVEAFSRYVIAVKHATVPHMNDSAARFVESITNISDE